MKLAPAALAAALALAQGCVSLERSYPEKHYYALGPERKAARRAVVPHAVLRVSACRIGPGYDKARIVYRRSDHAYETDFYNEYFLPPGDLVTAALRDWLARSGLFESVVAEGSLVDAGLVLETSVPAIYADFRGEKPSAVLAFQALLIRDGPDGPAVLLERSWRETVPLAGGSAPEVVAGLDQALAKVLGSLEAEIARVDLRQAAAPGAGSPTSTAGSGSAPGR